MRSERLNELLSTGSAPVERLNSLTSQPDCPPICVYMQNGNYCAVMFVEPFQFNYHWWSADPNVAVATVRQWYFDVFSKCRHKVLNPAINPNCGCLISGFVECEQCSAIFGEKELSLLIIQ